MFNFRQYFSHKRRVVLMASAALILFVALGIERALNSSVANIENSVYLYVDNDDTIDSLQAKVAHLGGKEHVIFNCLTDCFDFKVRAGRYKIVPKQGVLSTVLMLKRGQQSPTKLLIPTGWTIEGIASKICNQLMIDSAEFMNCVNDSATLKLLQCDKESLPARFIPNTYEVWWNTSAIGLLKRISREYNLFWNDERKQKAADIGLTPDEVSTLASIVCRETNDTQEMPIIAGVYYNRLKRRMPLQSCPTVIFARQDFKLTRLTNPMLPDSPYNTYRYAGLPPGPICIPTIKSIDAVLNMPKHKYIYMCAREDFSGKHNFSATYSEHQRYAKKYQRAYKKRFGNR